MVLGYNCVLVSAAAIDGIDGVWNLSSSLGNLRLGCQSNRVLETTFLNAFLTLSSNGEDRQRDVL